jgi:CRISPR system Cascade subunit CasD
MRCLLLRLEGPLMAFGDVAVDEIRPTRRLPTLSMLTGLLANALGLDHREVAALARLQARLRFAARRDRPGRVLVDYQTARLNKRDPLWTTRGVPGERGGGGSTWDARGFGTVERRRHYLVDAAVTVALALDPEDEPPTVDHLAEALRYPARPLFLGRKSCPPARPLLERLPFPANCLTSALASVPCAEAVGAEVSDHPAEPPGRRTLEVADLRDWRAGFHAGSRRVREVSLPGSGDSP